MIHHGVSRPQGAQDARCVRSISAIRNDLRVPAPRAFPAHSRNFRCAEVPWSLWLQRTVTGDQGVSRRPRSLRRIDIEHGTSRPEPLARPIRIGERGRFLPTAHDAIEPLTLLSPLPLPPHVHAPSRVQTVRSVSFAYGSEEGRSRQGRDPRHLVKGDASRWPGVPSIVRDPS